jgi:hypothetical protein
MTCLPEFMSWGNLAAIANSGFTTSLVGALAGAYAGAYAAQKITARNKVRAEFQAQIRNTNAAITLSFMVFNAAIALKGQQTKELCDAFFKKKTELERFIEKGRTGDISLNIPFEFLQADLRIIPFPAVPIDALRSLLYEKLSVSARLLACVATLDITLSSIDKTIATRDEFITSFKNNKDLSEGDRTALYFGLPYGHGRVDNVYLDSMTGLQDLTNDAIFFSHMLCKDLETHGNKVLDKFKAQYKGVIEQIHAIELSPEKTVGLMPSQERYSEWLSSFRGRK